MCTQRTLYTTALDPYCGFIKQYFNAQGLEYKEVDISSDITGFYELTRFYGKGPLPVIVEDDTVIPVHLAMHNAHVMR